MARSVTRWRVDVDSLHIGDSVFFGDRQMWVLNVNRTNRRVLVSGRKHSCNNCEILWLDEHRLGTRPRKMVNRVIKSIHHVSGVIAEAIAWVPTRDPKPTRAIPGSREKIEVLRMRVTRGENLWHADDVINFESFYGDRFEASDETEDDLFCRMLGTFESEGN